MKTIHSRQVQGLVKSEYNLQEIQIIFQFLEDNQSLFFPSLSNGLFPAAVTSAETQYTCYSSVWVRDNIYVAYSHYILGKTDIAIKTVSSLMSYFKKYKNRFEQIINREADSQDPMNRPHIRFNGTSLEEIDQKWAHAQNDALGYFLWFYCNLVREGKLDLQQEDVEVLALFALYFQVIHYWEDEDSGHWEEVRKIEASSIGVVIAGLKSLKRLYLQFDFISHCCRYENKLVTIHLIDDLLEEGVSALQKILPSECIEPESKKRRFDAALLFLIYPLHIVEENIADQILQDVIGNLQGDYGIKRYLGDSFWAPDYKKKLPPETRTTDISDDSSLRDSLLTPSGEAQWCIFDPIISAIFGSKFQKTKQKVYLERQIEYLNRSLGQLTGEDCEFGGLRCPELYYSENGKYVPNDSTPLLWTQANLAVSLKMVEHSLLQHEP